MFGGFILNGYQGAIPALAPFANLTWFGWTTNHLPLAGAYDWPSLSLVASSRSSCSSHRRRGVRPARHRGDERRPDPEPAATRSSACAARPRRTFGNGLPTALAWGLGLGHLRPASSPASATAFIDLIETRRTSRGCSASVFPGIDIGTVGGFLQLLFVEFGLILAGLAAATLVGGWASDETSGRLEMLLATPLARARWVVAGGVGVFVAIIVVVGLAALASRSVRQAPAVTRARLRAAPSS